MDDLEKDMEKIEDELKKIKNNLILYDLSIKKLKTNIQSNELIIKKIKHIL